MNAAKRILIIKLGAIGDVVMASSLITAIKNDDPKNEITWICGETVAPLLQLFKDIDRLIAVDDRALLSGKPVERILQIAGIWKATFLKQYDMIITPYRDTRYKILSLCARTKHFRSYMKPGTFDSIIPGRYFASEYVRLFTGISDYRTVHVQFPKPELPPLENIRAKLPENGRKKVILFPGGAKNILNEDDVRRYPVEKYALIAKELIASGYAVLLLGAKSDAWAAAAFAALPVINLIGETTLPELVFVLQNAAAMISHDTGILHIAKLTKTPCIGLYGPLQPREIMDARENIIPLWGGENLPCAPCYDGKKFASCTNNICMKNISPELIVAQLQIAHTDADAGQTGAS